MNTSNTDAVMALLQGRKFEVVGPFFVADLSRDLALFARIPTGENGMERVGVGERTQAHTHRFPSFYRTEGLDVESAGKKFKLPARALTLVLPEVEHSWVSQGEDGAVGSVGHAHERQVTQPLQRSLASAA